MQNRVEERSKQAECGPEGGIGAQKYPVLRWAEFESFIPQASLFNYSFRLTCRQSICRSNQGRLFLALTYDAVGAPIVKMYRLVTP